MKKLFFNYLVIAAIAVVVGIGLSACGQANTQNGGNVNNVDRIPDGTYISRWESWTFSGNKVTVSSQSDRNGTFTYFVKEGDIIRYDDYALIEKYFLDGENLIIFSNFYKNYASGSTAEGTIFRKQ